MANEKEANLARDQHADFLRDLGAHGITIDEVKQSGKPTFAVVAMFERTPKAIPNTLPVRSGKKTMDVPLVARVTEKFKPE
jgi:hypothetical protein